MLFNSFTFWLFLAVVLMAYFRLGHKSQNRMLLLASYVFYGWWDWRFLSLIWISTIVDYFVALRIDSVREGHRGGRPERATKLWLTLSVVTNLGILAFFKYFGFFVSELGELLQAAGMAAIEPSLRIVLPVGISFYTFQTMSYTIDVYRGQTRPTRNIFDFALYVAFFPQLVAGPIERSTRLLPQIQQPRRYGGSEFAEGLHLILLGLFKKIVIADNMAFIVNGIFRAEPSELSGLDCLVGTYAFAFQIYGDFSGYSSIARGVAKWLGFDLMVNFRMPYFARSPREFWQRWHISLSTWLRDYLYIPLGGSRCGKWRTHRNLLATMVLGGLWHGAGWTFLAWGLFHGLILCFYRAVGIDATGRQSRLRVSPMRSVVAGLVTFHLVCMGWLLFRASSIEQAYAMVLRMVAFPQPTELTVYALTVIAFYVVPLILLESWLEWKKDLWGLLRSPWLVRSGAYSYFAVMLLLFRPTVYQEFIYFQF
jgi:D-alanyl-lipoteichoic acid acyltransferase DltB (MBOAT superfamily)